MRAGGLRAVGNDRHGRHPGPPGRPARHRRRRDGPRRTSPGPRRRTADRPRRRPAACAAGHRAPRRGLGGDLSAGLLHLDAPGRSRRRHRRLHRHRPAGLGGHRTRPGPPPAQPALAVRRRPGPARHHPAVRRRGRPRRRHGSRLDDGHAARCRPGPGRRHDVRPLLLGRAPAHHPWNPLPCGDGRRVRARRAAPRTRPAGDRWRARQLLVQCRRRCLHGRRPHVRRVRAVRLGAGARPGEHRHDPVPPRTGGRGRARRPGRR